VDTVRGSGSRNDGDFAAARQLTTWHYQWMLVHEFLPEFVGQELVDDVLKRGPRFYRARGDAVIPVEFSGAPTASATA
jgi:hypothetical protein